MGDYYNVRQGWSHCWSPKGHVGGLATGDSPAACGENGGREQGALFKTFEGTSKVQGMRYEVRSVLRNHHVNNESIFVMELVPLRDVHQNEGTRDEMEGTRYKGRGTKCV